MATAVFSKFTGIVSTALSQHHLSGFEIAQLEFHLLHSVTAAAATKSLQSCPTLCDPIVSSPPGSSVPGILQALVPSKMFVTLIRKCSSTEIV